MIRRALLLSSLFLFACGSPPAPASPPAPGAPPASAKAAVASPAQGTPAPPSLDRTFLRTYSATRAFSRGAPVGSTLTPDGKSVLFLRSAARDKKQSLFELDVASGRARELLAPDALASGSEHLTQEERARRERMRITANGFTSFELSRDGKTVVVSLSGKLFALDRASGKAHPIDIGEGAAIDPQISPDGARVAFVQNDDVHVVPVDGRGKASALTRGGTDTKPHGLADFCASEELERYRGFYWSPDSKSLLVEEFDASKLEKLTIADPAHPETPADVIPYPRAGHTNAVVRFGVVSVASPGAVTWATWDHDALPYVATVSWDDHAPPTLVALDRLQKNASVLVIDPRTGKTREAIHEHDDAWVNVDPSVPAWLPDGSAFVWMSERDGDRRYGLVPASGAGDVKWLTPKGMQAEGVLDLDGDKRAMIFEGTRDGLHRDVLRVALDGGAEKVVAHLEDGTVVAHFTEGLHDRFVAREASPKAQPRRVVRTLDGTVAAEIPSVAEEAPLPNVTFETVGPDAVRVGLVRPHGFVQGARYALLDSAYAGPHSQVVHVDSRAWLLDQWMADATGAIVISLDAKGTLGRGRAWERAILGKLGDVPLDGHVSAIAALIAAHPEIDPARVGVYGWSFGGYFSALAALRRPDVYSAAMAIAPPADWRDYDTAYTERYLGLPQDAAAAYDAASLLTYAGKPAEGRLAALTIAHGTADDNVYFLNSLKLTDALAKAGREFHFLPFVGQTHQFASEDAFEGVWLQAATHLRAGLER
ncbi:MAG TPA: DPP IV N-terminal domain-containing protein [Polyangiaceae bacterium]